MITAYGAVIGLAIAIVLILKKVPPVYGMMIGALIGALVGGASLVEATTLMVNGTKNMSSAIIRILSAGILSGVLIGSGGAEIIAETLVKKIGETRSLLALSIATLVLTSVGVFIDVAVITVAPIAITIATKTNLSRMSILIAMIGGGKAGNVMSPNPNAIAASEAFDIPLTSVIVGGIIPAIAGLIVTYIVAKKLVNKGSKIELSESIEDKNKKLPKFWAAMSAPITAIILLSLRPILGINIDPLIALPTGGIVGAIAMNDIKKINEYATLGLSKMSGVAIMLIGTGTLAGVIANSQLKDVIINSITQTELPSFLLAPVSGALMSLAVASTTAGTTVASSVFAPTLLELGVAPIAGAVMIHAGATVFDHMPHGSFFHSTGGSVNMKTQERLKLLVFESIVGFSIAVVATVLYGIILG